MCPIDTYLTTIDTFLKEKKPLFVLFTQQCACLSIRTRRNRDITFSILCKYTTTCNASILALFNCIVVNDLNSGTLKKHFLNTFTSAMKMEVISV